jgi:hypothetical protein
LRKIAQRFYLWDQRRLVFAGILYLHRPGAAGLAHRHPAEGNRVGWQPQVIGLGMGEAEGRKDCAQGDEDAQRLPSVMDSHNLLTVSNIFPPTPKSQKLQFVFQNFKQID